MASDTDRACSREALRVVLRRLPPDVEDRLTARVLRQRLRLGPESFPIVLMLLTFFALVLVSLVLGMIVGWVVGHAPPPEDPEDFTPGPLFAVGCLLAIVPFVGFIPLTAGLYGPIIDALLRREIVERPESGSFAFRACPSCGYSQRASSDVCSECGCRVVFSVVLTRAPNQCPR